MIPKLMLLILFGIHVMGTKPPDNVGESNSTKRDVFTSGSSSSSSNTEQKNSSPNPSTDLDDSKLFTKIQYTADNLGFQSILRNNHTEVISHFAIGDDAIQSIHNDSTKFYQINNYTPSMAETNVKTTRPFKTINKEDSITKVLSMLFPNGIEEHQKQDFKKLQHNYSNDEIFVTESSKENSINVDDVTEKIENLLNFEPRKTISLSKNNLVENSSRASRQQNLTYKQSTNKSLQDLVSNEDILQINAAIETTTISSSTTETSFEILQSSPDSEYLDSFPTYNQTSLEDMYHYDDLSGFISPIVVEDNLLSPSQDIDRMYILPPSSPNEVQIIPSNENFVNQVKTATESPQINVQIVADDISKSQQSKDSKISNFQGYEVKEKFSENLIPTTQSTSRVYLPNYIDYTTTLKPSSSSKLSAQPKSSVSVTTETELFITPNIPSSSKFLAPIQVGLQISNNDEENLVSSTTPISQQYKSSTEKGKTIVEIQKSINIHNMMIKQAGNYFEQHEEYLLPYFSTTTQKLNSITTTPSPITHLSEQNIKYHQVPSSSPATIYATKPQVSLPSTSHSKFLKNSLHNSFQNYIPSETMISSVPLSYQVISKEFSRIPTAQQQKQYQQQQSYTKNPNSNNYYVPNLNLNNNNKPTSAPTYINILQNLPQKPTAVQQQLHGQNPYLKIYSTFDQLHLNQRNKNNLGQKPNHVAVNLLQNNQFDSKDSQQGPNIEKHHQQYHNTLTGELLMIPTPSSSSLQTVKTTIKPNLQPSTVSNVKVTLQNHQMPGSSSSSSINNNNNSGGSGGGTILKEMKKQVVYEKLVDQPFQIEVPKFVIKQKLQPQQQHQIYYSSSYPQTKGKFVVEKLVDKLPKTSNNNIGSSSSTNNNGNITPIMRPIQIQIPFHQMPFHIPVPVQMPVAVAETPFQILHPPPPIQYKQQHQQYYQTSSTSNTIPSESLSFENNHYYQRHPTSHQHHYHPHYYRHHHHHSQQQQQHPQLQNSHHISTTGTNNNPFPYQFENTLPLNYQVTFLGQQDALSHPLPFHSSTISSQRNEQIGNRDSVRGIGKMEIESESPKYIGDNYGSYSDSGTSNVVNVLPNEIPFYCNIPSFKYANNFSYKNTNSNDNNDYYTNDYKNIVNNNENDNPYGIENSNNNISNTSISNHLTRKPNDVTANQINNNNEYIGPIPLQNEQSHWNSRRVTQYKRSFDFGKNLKMEYGFKPPMIPSIEIDEQGMPINKKSE